MATKWVKLRWINPLSAKALTSCYLNDVLPIPTLEVCVSDPLVVNL